MKRVIVIGCPGSGKTIFSEKLNKSTGMPLYHLDAIWHKPDKTHVSREEFDERLAEIFKTPEWIIDGNYNRTIGTRIQQCDTVFLFDLPTEVCLQGATERLGKGRNDLPWIEKELDPEFEGFIKDFAEKSLPRIYELLEKYKANKQVIIFKSREEADEYLKVQGEIMRENFPIRYGFLREKLIERDWVGEINFSIVSDEIYDDCWMGCFSDGDTPYWFGLTPDGKQAYDYATADELLSAKVFNGKSMAELWDKVKFHTLDAISDFSWASANCWNTYHAREKDYEKLPALLVNFGHITVQMKCATR